MTIITHIARYRKTAGNFTTVEEALIDFRCKIPQDYLDALQAHENQCLADGVVTEPASYEFDPIAQVLSIIKKTENTDLLLERWINDPIRASVKEGYYGAGWRFVDQTPDLTPTTTKWKTHYEDVGVRVGNIAVDSAETVASFRG